MSEDMVKSPKHYTQGHIETIYAIEKALGPEGFKAYCMGNWIKYSSRHKEKGGDEDLQKAEVYLGWAVNGLPTPVDGKLPGKDVYKDMAGLIYPRKFKVGDHIHQKGHPQTYTVTEVMCANYKIETNYIVTYISFDLEPDWELIK